ncbi:MAG: peroxiredoxin-like family protein [Magnetospirillum sp.]
MSLTQDLADQKTRFMQTAPTEVATLFQARIEDLALSFPLDQAVGKGALAPDFVLPEARGGAVRLADLLYSGPVVLAFYRGAWCPYCNLQLRAYQQALPEMESLGARLLAVSPQMPDKSLSTAETNALSFAVLSDVGNHVARDFGLVFTLPADVGEVLTKSGRALPDFNGDQSWELPVPATYVIAQDRRVALASIDVDYRTRLDPADIIDALRVLPRP